MIGIFRHSKAETNADEMGRPLTEEGIAWAKKVSGYIDTTWDMLLTSPAERAQQTGVILSSLVPTVIEGLYVNSDPTDQSMSELMEELSSYINKQDNVMIVTHQPMLDPLLKKISSSAPNIASLKAGEGVLLNNGEVIVITHDTLKE
jgi:phosphohistidine phosphatase SixA